MTPVSVPPNVIAICGPSGSGKTELICRLIAWFKEHGLKVAVLKHGHERKKIAESQEARAYHTAGAQAVALAGPCVVQITLYQSGEPDPDEILKELSAQADLVIVEGFKHSHLPRIILAKPQAETGPVDREGIIAWVSREPADLPKPVFHPDEIGRIGAFILEFVKRPGKGENSP